MKNIDINRRKTLRYLKFLKKFKGFYRCMNETRATLNAYNRALKATPIYGRGIIKLNGVFIGEGLMKTCGFEELQIVK